jgi:flagellar basal body-associated protein FliL
MKKYNLEEQLADKLGNRSITPSDNAWERIAFNRQQQAGKSKQKKKRGLFMIAAVLLMFLTCGYFVTVMFMAEKPSGALQQVVQEDIQVKEIKPGKIKVQEADSKELFVVARNEVKQSAQKNNTPVMDKVNVQMAENKADEQSLVMTPSEIKTDEASIRATAPVIAESRTQEDVLLEKAMKDLAERKQIKATTNQAALLKEVESEMDEYYRERALRFFSLKYKKIRIVVKDNHNNH